MLSNLCGELMLSIHNHLLAAKGQKIEWLRARMQSGVPVEPQCEPASVAGPPGPDSAPPSQQSAPVADSSPVPAHPPLTAGLTQEQIKVFTLCVSKISHFTCVYLIL